MKKLLIVHENFDGIKKIKEKLSKFGYLVIYSKDIQNIEHKIKTEQPDLILFGVKNIIEEDKNDAVKLIKKNIDNNVAINYIRLVEKMNDIPIIKGVNLEKETILLIDEVKKENKVYNRISRIDNEVLQYVKKDGKEINKNGKLFIEKKELNIENEAILEIHETKAFAFVPLEKRYKELNGIEIKTEYNEREITEFDTKNITEFTNETLGIIKNSVIKKPKELIEFEESYEELQILLSEIEYMKSEFITFVSHEIGTPLAIIKGNIELMADGAFGKLNIEQKKRLKTVQKNVDRLTKIIRDTMELMKIESNKLNLEKEVFSITELAKEVVDELQIIAQKKEHELLIDFKKNIPQIMADKNRIRQVLNNLINNAIKYTSKEGKINVIILKENNYLHIMVRDNGIGIPLEEQNKIFAKFYKVSNHLEDASGTGLGLAICKGVIDAHDGEIWVESKTGKGATFHLRIPIEVVE